MRCRPILFAATTDSESSRDFYENLLGLSFVSDQPYALVFDVDGVQLRVQKVERVVELPYTSLGFEVEEIVQTVASLAARGVTFERFEMLAQDELGIWTTPDGARVAWCRDPDGSLLSLTQHG